ncbi:Bgt-4141 [Blumeria graminis f. sp. tritici]|uniref:histidine kinase n=2 Tax=Blumeria graminis f. sp. tritici TaxID=62690 RepID=A0A9X9PRF0_BLUGR|nr:Bgt-4141 [Blumeria graminis f. sp. tritici]
MSGQNKPVNFEYPFENVRGMLSAPCLTAFAQLGVLRLNAKCGYIVLSTCDPNGSIFVLAESGTGPSLRKTDGYNDGLWNGVGAINKQADLVNEFLEIFKQPQGAPKHIFIADITGDSKYTQHFTMTVNRIRSMAIVPLKSLEYGAIIGTYIVIDNKPRECTTEAEIEFLLDTATMITDYLERECLNSVQHQADKMLKALGLFIEGGSSLQDKQTKEEVWTKKSFEQNLAIDQKQMGSNDLTKSRTHESTASHTKQHIHLLQDNFYNNICTKSSTLCSKASKQESTVKEMHSICRDRKISNEFKNSHSESKLKNSHSESKLKKIMLNSRPSLMRNISLASMDSNFSDTTPSFEKHFILKTEVQSETTSSEKLNLPSGSSLTSDIKKVFARASNLIRESISIDGVVYFNAAHSSSRASSHFKMDEISSMALRNKHPLCLFADETSRHTSETDFTGRCCEILGFSTNISSSLHGHDAPDELLGFPLSILRKMLNHYPRGLVFNFGDDGSLIEPEEITHSAQHDLSKYIDAAEIHTILPKARSVFWLPLWDQNCDRWFSGCFIWSNYATETLSSDQGTTYLATFGNSTMAEISRLSAKVLSKMKADFVSNISHELRSPLHGVLASVEFLKDTQMRKILLDTINHVLDFSKVNPKRKEEKNLLGLSKNKFGIGDGSDDRTGKTDISIISEEVIETIYAGHFLTQSVFFKGNQHISQDLSPEICPISVIIKIPFRQNWIYEINKGAWRRILMNLFDNAIRYTSTGFVTISLDVEDHNDLSASKDLPPSTLILKIEDTGRGISPNFLKHQLYKPFTQEDTLSTGAGLGLSIVKAIVNDLSGTIVIHSEPLNGTEVTVRLPLKQSSVPKKIIERKMIMEVRARCEGLKVQMIGFSRHPDHREEPSGNFSMEIMSIIKLQNSLEACLQDWFGLQILASDQKEIPPDLFVILEGGLNDRPIQSVLNTLGHQQGNREKVAMILTNRCPNNTNNIKMMGFRYFYLHQSYGPHKIAKVLFQEYCNSKDATLHQLDMPSQGQAMGSPPPTQSSKLVWSPQTALDHSIHMTPKLSKELSPPIFSTTSSFSISQRSIPTTISHPLSSPVKDQTPMISEDIRVLLVEDNKINLRLLVATMKKLKTAYATATNGLEALNTYKEYTGKFDAIFMDISMPVMSGIESSKNIRTYERENNLNPVVLIALTGAANESTRQEAFSNGIDIFLTKPVPMKALGNMLEVLSHEGRLALLT